MFLVLINRGVQVKQDTYFLTISCSEGSNCITLTHKHFPLLSFDVDPCLSSFLPHHFTLYSPILAVLAPPEAEEFDHDKDITQ